MCLRGSAADYARSAAKVVLSGSAARTMRGGRSVPQLHHAVGGMEEGKKGEKKTAIQRQRDVQKVQRREKREEESPAGV